MNTKNNIYNGSNFELQKIDLNILNTLGGSDTEKIFRIGVKINDLIDKIRNLYAIYQGLQNEIEDINSAIDELKALLTELRTDLEQEIVDRQESDSLLNNKIEENVLSIINLQNQINAEKIARENADTTLQNNIDAEEQARIDSVNLLNDSINTNGNNIISLQNQINAETENRESADTTLQNNIDAETQARIESDNLLDNNINTNGNNIISLQNQINAEVTARENADTTLQNNIDAIKVNDFNILKNASSIMTYDVLQRGGINYLTLNGDVLEKDFYSTSQLTHLTNSTTYFVATAEAFPNGYVSSEGPTQSIFNFSTAFSTGNNATITISIYIAPSSYNININDLTLLGTKTVDNMPIDINVFAPFVNQDKNLYYLTKIEVITEEPIENFSVYYFDLAPEYEDKLVQIMDNKTCLYPTIAIDSTLKYNEVGALGVVNYNQQPSTSKVLQSFEINLKDLKIGNNVLSDRLISVTDSSITSVNDFNNKCIIDVKINSENDRSSHSTALARPLLTTYYQHMRENSFECGVVVNMSALISQNADVFAKMYVTIVLMG